MLKKINSSFSALFLSSVLGGFVGFTLATFIPSTTANARGADYVVARSIELVDSKGARRMMAGTNENGAVALWFFDQKGKSKLNLGLYEDGNSFVVLNDQNEQAVQILRTVGPKDSPVLVQKANGQDKVIFGLNMRDGQPSLMYNDQNGTTNVFGNYNG